ncbi:MAG: zinc ribbon domain-containing protein [Syntrophales bacterium]|jgi:putative FmdB family regulatory protein|nr:zinc ribbon domain-containing protein [Syntrophales bacterium]
MPIYEFYCENCNTVFNFFSRGVNTQATPVCPRCQGPLKRQLSLFAKVSRGKEESLGEEMPQLDEAKMEKAMAMLAGEAEKMDENDPRQAAQLMRKLSEAAGISFGDGMEDALNRLERGEDPDRIEEEMGSLLDAEEPVLLNKKGSGRKRPAPRVDETLYDL